jgi:hypothetical protein
MLSGNYFVMQSISESRYFFWGSAFPNQYALYSPAVNRFILVDASDQMLEYACFLLSSKINLVIVPLHTARNFGTDIIDNSCCADWGIEKSRESTRKLVPALFSARCSYYLDSVEQLQIQPPAPQTLLELQKLALLTAHVINFFRFGQHVMYTKFNGLVSVPFETKKFDAIRRQETQCYDLLYLADNYDAVVSRVEAILAQCHLATTADD